MLRVQSFLVRPPWIGLLAFAVVFLVQALGHTVMILMEEILGERYVYMSAILMGVAGAAMLWHGMRLEGEHAPTWLGFFAGTFLWTGWVEFSFVWNAAWLGVPDARDAGAIVTKAEYLVMMSSVGIMMSTLAYFLFNRNTRCSFFHWLQRHARLSTGKAVSGYRGNLAAITALETIYVIWFFYLALLFIYAFVGERHPLTYGLFFLNTIWALLLFKRLVRFRKMSAAIRYGIPTAIIGWTSVELLVRWNTLTEMWVYPNEYWLEMTLIFGAFAVVTIVSVLTPDPAKSSLDQ